MKNQALFFWPFIISLFLLFAANTLLYRSRNKIQGSKRIFSKRTIQSCLSLIQGIKTICYVKQIRSIILLPSRKSIIIQLSVRLKQNESRAEDKAKEYIDLEKNNARVQMMNFHLGEYYFRRQEFSEAADRIRTSKYC